MKRTLLVLVLATLFFALQTPAGATCSPPFKPGATLCFPTSNSTVTYPLAVEGAATGQNGLPIVKMVLYADGQKVYETDNYDTLTDPGDYNIAYNGKRHLVLNAWDSAGNLFQYSEYVNLIGGEPPLCSAPAKGINICAPTPGSYQPNNGIPMVVAGSSGIQRYDMYFNGQFAGSSNSRNLIGQLGTGTVTSKPNTLSFKAYDAQGHPYTASTTFYLYYEYVCGPKGGCSPGISIQSPGDYQDVNSPFTVSAQVEQNPAQITTMKVYLDNTLVGSSTGPTMRAEVSAAHGTHLLTVQAWDTTGALYKTQQTVNVY